MSTKKKPSVARAMRPRALTAEEKRLADDINTWMDDFLTVGDHELISEPGEVLVGKRVLFIGEQVPQKKLKESIEDFVRHRVKP